MALALFVLPAARPVESEAVPPHSELASDGGERTASTLGARDEMAPPELLYVAWHRHGIKFTGKPKGPVTVWNLQGDLLSERESANLMDQLGSCMIHWRTEGELYPLLLVFKVDDRLTRGPLSADIVTESGLRLHGGSARNVPTHGMNVSVVAPSANEFAAWPERITVEVAYPVEEVTVIKTLTEVPNEPVEIARGVTWYLDPDRAVTFSSLGTKRAVGKTSWVLQKGRDEQTRLMSYAARVYQSDDERLDTSYHTILGEPGGELQSLVVSEPFDNREQIKRVEFVRQQRRLIRFDNIPVRLQDMPQAGD